MTRNAEFQQAVRRAAWERCGGICECGCGVEIVTGDGPEFHHRVEDWLGGEPTLENCWCVRRRCHKRLTKERAPALAKVRRLEKERKGWKAPVRKLPGGRESDWKFKVGGGRVPREPR